MNWKGGQVLRMLRDATARGLKRSAVVVQNEVRTQLSKGGGGGAVKNFGKHAPAGQPPFVQTGHLRRSWQMGNPNAVYDASKATAVPTALVRVGSNVPYARIHEFGGVVRAKRAKYLTIPLNVNAYRLIRNHGTTAKIPGLFRVGNALARRRGKGKRAKLEVLFALKRSVRIPKRPYVRPALKIAGPKVVATLTDSLRTIKGATVR